MKTVQHQDGYIALITVILISVSLLTMVVAVSFEGFFSRFSVLESEQKETSAYLAESCFNTAVLMLAQDDDYSGNESIDVGTESCDIKNITTSGSFAERRTIQTQGIKGDAYTNLEITIDLDSLPSTDVVSWVEMPSF